MVYDRHPLYQRQYNHPYQSQMPFQQPFQQPIHNTQLPNSMYQQQPQSPYEQFAKPKQPQDWYSAQQQDQGNYQQAYGGNSTNGVMSQFHDENGQINLDKVLSTVSQVANTYHQVSPIIKQFGSFMKTFR